MIRIVSLRSGSKNMNALINHKNRLLIRIAHILDLRWNFDMTSSTFLGGINRYVWDNCKPFGIFQSVLFFNFKLNCKMQNVVTQVWFLLLEHKRRKYCNRVYRPTLYFYIFSIFHDPYSTKKVVSRFRQYVFLLFVCLSGVYIHCFRRAIFETVGPIFCPILYVY